jgi:O-antigen/teichoic acid export membrane protein
MLLLKQVKTKFSGNFIHNIGWLGSAELINRIFGLGTTIVLSRIFSFQDYGLLAIVLTVYEFGNIFTGKAGIGAKLVQASEKEVDALCETAYWMSWFASAAIFLTQCLISFPIAWFYQDNRIIAPLCVSGLMYLFLPLMTVQAAMLERQGRLNVFAACHVGRSLIANVLTIIFIILGWKYWAVVAAGVIAMLAWVVIPRMAYEWHPKTSFTLYRWREIASYAGNILGVEFLSKLRDNLDYLLVGRFLGLEALGIYYFAFNAGLGISLSIINALTASLWPHLCGVHNDLASLQQRYLGGLKTIASVIIPMVLLQASLAPWYVPIVFGEARRVAIPILMIICLSAIPRPFFLAATQLLNSINRTHISLRWSIGFTMVYAILLTIGVGFGLIHVAIAVLASQILITPIFVFWVTNAIFKAKYV